MLYRPSLPLVKKTLIVSFLAAFFPLFFANALLYLFYDNIQSLLSSAGFQFLESVSIVDAVLYAAVFSFVLLFCIAYGAAAKARNTSNRITRLNEALEDFLHGSFRSALSYKKNAYDAQSNFFDKTFSEIEGGCKKLAQNLKTLLVFTNKEAMQFSEGAALHAGAQLFSAACAVINFSIDRNPRTYASAREADKVINKFLESIFPYISRKGGFINKIWDDGGLKLLVIWKGGAPDVNIRNALRSCVLINSKVRSLNKDFITAALRTGGIAPEIKISAGASLGEIALCGAGAEGKKELTALGGVIKDALEASTAAPQGKVYATAGAFTTGGADFSAQGVQVNGKTYFDVRGTIMGEKYGRF